MYNPAAPPSGAWPLARVKLCLDASDPAASLPLDWARSAAMAAGAAAAGATAGASGRQPTNTAEPCKLGCATCALFKGMCCYCSLCHKQWDLKATPASAPPAAAPSRGADPAFAVASTAMAAGAPFALSAGVAAGGAAPRAAALTGLRSVLAERLAVANKAVLASLRADNSAGTVADGGGDAPSQEPDDLVSQRVTEVFVMGGRSGLGAARGRYALAALPSHGDEPGARAPTAAAAGARPSGSALGGRRQRGRSSRVGVILPTVVSPKFSPRGSAAAVGAEWGSATAFDENSRFLYGNS